MSITGISAASSAIYTLQPQNAASAGTTTPAATPQTAAPCRSPRPRRTRRNSRTKSTITTTITVPGAPRRHPT